MTAHLELLIELHAEVMRASEQLGATLSTLDHKITAAIVEERDRQRRDMLRQTITGVTGTPCVADVVWDEEPIGHVEPVDSSQMIPPEQLDRSARGGE